MRIIFLLFCFCLSVENGIAQTPVGFPDTPSITEKSVGRAQIGMTLAKLKVLYPGCTFTPTHLARYGFDDYDSKPNGVTVSYGKQKLFVYFSDWQTRKKIVCLIALHPAYQTVQGIHVGSTSGQLKAKLPAIKVVPNMIMQDIEIAFVGENSDLSTNYVFFRQGNVGKYVVADEPVRITALNAKISWIQVYPH